MVGNKKRKSEVNTQSKSKTTNSKAKSIPQYQLFLHPSAPGNKLTVFRSVAITDVQFQRWLLINNVSEQNSESHSFVTNKEFCCSIRNKVQATLVPYMGWGLSFLIVAPCEVIQAVDQSQLARILHPFLVLFMAPPKSMSKYSFERQRLSCIMLSDCQAWLSVGFSFWP